MTTDVPYAPWNKKCVEREIDVTVSITLSKTVKVTVCGDSDENTDLDLDSIVEDQIVLPHNLSRFTRVMFNEDLDLKEAGIPQYLNRALDDCNGWNVDEMECILE